MQSRFTLSEQEKELDSIVGKTAVDKELQKKAEESEYQENYKSC